MTTDLIKTLEGVAKFQIRETDKDGCGSFYYFEAPVTATLDEVGKLAEEKANEAVLESHSRRMNRARFSFLPVSAPRLKQTLNVVEIVGKKYMGKLHKRDGTIEEKEMTDWKAKRKGIRLKLKLSFCEITYRDGTKKRMEGYQYAK